MHPPIKKVVLFFFILVCFVLSLHFSEGKTIVRVKKPKYLGGPKHIQSLVKLNHGIYAREYSYEKPLSNFVLKRRNGRQLRKKRKTKKKVRVVPWNDGIKTYARKYKTWAPSKEFISGNHLVLDTIENRPNKKRRRPPPVIIDDDLITETTKKRRRVRPNRPPGNLHRPFPPDQDIVYEDYEGADFFPEETKRLEIDYDVDDRFRPQGGKKRRPPGLRKKKIKKPELNSRFPFDDDNHLTPDGRYKPSLKEPTISYSNFIQHPTSTRGETDYDYPEEDDRFLRNESKKKRRRVKKKTSSKDRKREKINIRPAESEEEFRIPGYVSDAERYQYQISEEQEYQRNAAKQKRNKPRYEPTQNTVYGDGHISSPNNIDDSRYSNNFVRAPSRPELISQNAQNFQQNTFSPAYSRPVQQNPQPFMHPIYENNNFDQQMNVNRFNSRPTNLQQSIPVVNNFNPSPSSGFSVSQNPFIKNQINQYDQQNSFPTNNFNPNNGYSTQVSSGTYQQPIYTRNTVSNPPVSNSYPNNFKSSPVFDNTESFYDFNNNANVNSQQSKQNFLASSTDYLQKYSSSNRLNTVVPSNNDPENEFIAKHQNLYNNGISGVPIQGDGFGNSRNHKNKDFDIGYGEFQFDENPNA